MSIGENIKQYRKGKMTQKELAKKLKKSERMIQKYENDEVTPSFDMLNEIANILNVSIDNLLEKNNSLSKIIIDFLEMPILQQNGFNDTLEVLSEDLNIDYALLEKCILKDKNLPLEAQLKLLKYLYDIDSPSFFKLLSKYKNKFDFNIFCELEEIFKDKPNELKVLHDLAGKNISTEKLSSSLDNASQKYNNIDKIIMNFLNEPLIKNELNIDFDYNSLSKKELHKVMQSIFFAIQLKMHEIIDNRNDK